MDAPINPPSTSGGGRNELPAYVSNGVIGMRVRDVPLDAGMTLISGYTGEHPLRQIEAMARAPYPCAGDLKINGVWLSEARHLSEALDQSYDFSCGELSTRFRFCVGDVAAEVAVLTFCDRVEPTLVCQEIVLIPGADCEVELRAIVDAGNVEGRALRQMRGVPGGSPPACDGALLWESAGAFSTCGIAYATQLIGAGDIEPARPPFGGQQLTSDYRFHAQAGRHYVLRHLTSVIPSQMHKQPDHQAVRLVCASSERGFVAIRAANREVWAGLWKGRIRIKGAPAPWQQLADAAVFYLLTSTHSAAPASTSIFGLATWHDYHYYYGHVMWDIETFIAPLLSLLQPGAAESILDFRFRNLRSAVSNARLRGRRGAQFPWQCAPSTGEECAPMPGSASWHEDHVSLDVAHAFALHAYITSDDEFLRTKAWPVLAEVAKWIESRVTRTARGYEIKAAMGIAERKQPADNSAFTNMSAVVVLRDALWAAKKLGRPVSPIWLEIAETMVLPMRDDVVISHDGFQADEEKGGTPDPLMGIFPLGYPLNAETQRATLNYYLELASDYLGSPMCSALYGVWAAYCGDRDLSARMLEEGYQKFCVPRFMQTLEYRRDVFPDQPCAGPFFANLGGFIYSLLLGFSGIRPGPEPIDQWTRRPVVLPAGWEAIEVERLWVGGRPMSLKTRQGADKSEIEPASRL